jgi:hypothetical protein
VSKTYKKWNQEELNFISANSSSMKDEEIADYLNKLDTTRTISLGMIRRQRRKLSIVKPRGRKPSAKSILSNTDG